MLKTFMGINEILKGRLNINDGTRCIGAKVFKKALKENNIEYVSVNWGYKTGFLRISDYGPKRVYVSLNSKMEPVDMTQQLIPKQIIFMESVKYDKYLYNKSVEESLERIAREAEDEEKH